MRRGRVWVACILEHLPRSFLAIHDETVIQGFVIDIPRILTVVGR